MEHASEHDAGIAEVYELFEKGGREERRDGESERQNERKAKAG